MKLFRRISILALVLVLVCLFSASAFAAVQDRSDNYELRYNDYESVVAEATIAARSTTGELKAYIYEYTQGTYSINLGCHYYSGDVLFYDTRNSFGDLEPKNSLTYSVASPKSMANATYTFYAEFNLSYSNYGDRGVFSPQAITVVY